MGCHQAGDRLPAVSVTVKAVRILIATAVAVFVLRAFGFLAVGILAVATQLTAMFIRRHRASSR